MTRQTKRLRGKAKRLRDRRIFDDAFPKDGTHGPPRVVLAHRYGLTVSGLRKAINSAAAELRKKNERMFLAQTGQIELREPEKEVTSEGLVELLEMLLTNK